VSQTRETEEVGFVISLALFLHKAPEAIGYGSFIAFSNLDIQKRLLYIAVSIPSTI